MNDIWQLIRECVQLFCWVFFQPYTFRHKLQAIHPDLEPNSNPFLLRAKFGENPKLKRHASQVYWLTIGAPIVIALIVAPVYSTASHTAFKYGVSGLFCAGWIIGVSLSTIASAKWSNRIYTGAAILVFGSIVFIIISKIFPHLLDPISRPISFYAFRLIKNITFLYPFAAGAVSGLAAGVGFGVAAGVGFGVAIGVATSVGSGVAFVLAFGLGSGLAFGILYGLAFGTLSGIAFGLVAGVFCILVTLRFYFWIPELLWMLFLRLIASPGKAASTLRSLPPTTINKSSCPSPSWQKSSSKPTVPIPAKPKTPSPTSSTSPTSNAPPIVP
jgi:uncharacterized protein